MKRYKSFRHAKFLLQYHIIFVCGYRKSLLVRKDICEDIKQLSYKICLMYKYHIKMMRTDKNHIHYLIETVPNTNIANLIMSMKSYITYYIWKRYFLYLKKHFWNEYIKNQKRKEVM